jgi:hypothetical protein
VNQVGFKPRVESRSSSLFSVLEFLSWNRHNPPSRETLKIRCGRLCQVSPSDVTPPSSRFCPWSAPKVLWQP